MGAGLKVLVVCDHGNNRSVTVAHQLKYRGNDVLSAGLQTNSPQTLHMLCQWAERIITTARDQRIPEEFESKVECWDIGPDNYPRPFNKDLLRLVRQFVEEKHG